MACIRYVGSLRMRARFANRRILHRVRHASPGLLVVAAAFRGGRLGPPGRRAGFFSPRMFRGIVALASSPAIFSSQRPLRLCERCVNFFPNRNTAQNPATLSHRHTSHKPGGPHAKPSSRLLLFPANSFPVVGARPGRASRSASHAASPTRRSASPAIRHASRAASATGRAASPAGRHERRERC